MKCLFILLLFFTAASSASGQNTYVKQLPFYYDQKLISHLQDSLKRHKAKPPFIAFLTNSHDKEITYFIWIKNNLMNVITISDSTISKPITGRKQHFLAKLNLPALAIQESEDQLKFMPPTNSLTTNIVFVWVGIKRYIIEQGDNHNYILNKSKDKLRASFFLTLLQDLEPLQNEWQVSSPYIRYK